MENEATKTVVKKVEAIEMSNIQLMMESLRRTGEYASDIAEIVLKSRRQPNHINVTSHRLLRSYVS